LAEARKRVIDRQNSQALREVKPSPSGGSQSAANVDNIDFRRIGPHGGPAPLDEEAHMMTARPAKRDATTRFAHDARLELFDEEGPIGALGSAGQRSSFSTWLTSVLPPEIAPLLQAFLFALLLDATFVALDRST
jgi:hypothetical protein